MNFSKLDHLRQTPRSLDAAMKGIPGDLFGSTPPAWWQKLWKSKESWEHSLIHAQLRYCGVVQANSDLFDKDEASWAPAVLLSSFDPRAADPQLMIDLLAMIDTAREDESYTGALSDLIDLLDDEDSDIKTTLPMSCTGGVLVKVLVSVIDPKTLPHGYMPSHRILPTLISRDGSEGEIIPPKHYL